MSFDAAVAGAGVVGAACALELARRGASVALLEAEPAAGLGASGTNSGVLHTGFDSPPGELETELILRAAELRDPVLAHLGVPVLRCGAELRPRGPGERAAVEALAENARRNAIDVELDAEGTLRVPGEAVTDPVAYTLALVAAACAHGAEAHFGFEVAGIRAARGSLATGDEPVEVVAATGERLTAAVVVNCAGLGAARVAALAGDRSFGVYPRKGEFLVFEAPAGERLDRILLPVPSRGTKGVLVFPTLDGHVIAGPTAVDLARPDWSVRAAAREEIVRKAAAMYPPLAGAEPVFAYAGLRPTGRGVNYVIRRSEACERLINAAAIRSTGLTASLAIGERVAELCSQAGLSLGEPEPLDGAVTPVAEGPWWRRSAEHWLAPA